MGRRTFEADYAIIPEVVEAVLALGADNITVRLSNKSLGISALVFDVEVSGEVVPDGNSGLRVTTQRHDGAVTKTIKWE